MNVRLYISKKWDCFGKEGNANREKQSWEGFDDDIDAQLDLIKLLHKLNPRGVVKG